jgi:hypothetical protein
MSNSKKLDNCFVNKMMFVEVNPNVFFTDTRFTKSLRRSSGAGAYITKAEYKYIDKIYLCTPYALLPALTDLNRTIESGTNATVYRNNIENVVCFDVVTISDTARKTTDPNTVLLDLSDLPIEEALLYDKLTPASSNTEGKLDVILNNYSSYHLEKRVGYNNIGQYLNILIKYTVPCISCDYYSSINEHVFVSHNILHKEYKDIDLFDFALNNFNATIGDTIFDSVLFQKYEDIEKINDTSYLIPSIDVKVFNLSAERVLCEYNKKKVSRSKAILDERNKEKEREAVEKHLITLCESAFRFEVYMSSLITHACTEIAKYITNSKNKTITKNTEYADFYLDTIVSNKTTEILYEHFGKKFSEFIRGPLFDEIYSVWEEYKDDVLPIITEDDYDEMPTHIEYESNKVKEKFKLDFYKNHVYFNLLKDFIAEFGDVSNQIKHYTYCKDNFTWARPPEDSGIIYNFRSIFINTYSTPYVCKFPSPFIEEEVFLDFFNERKDWIDNIKVRLSDGVTIFSFINDIYPKLKEMLEKVYSDIKEYRKAHADG